MDIDLGFGLFKTRQSVRLLHIDTPELRGGTPETKAAANEAKEHLEKLILKKEVIIKSYNVDSFGIWLAESFFYGRSINLQMVKDGHAKIYKENK